MDLHLNLHYHNYPKYWDSLSCMGTQFTSLDDAVQPKWGGGGGGGGGGGEKEGLHVLLREIICS